MASRKRTRLVEAAESCGNIEEENDDMEEIVEILEEELQPRYGIRFLAETIRSTLLEIAETNERNQERRHNELVHMLEKYFSQGSAEKRVESETKTTSESESLEPITQSPQTKDTSLNDVRELLKSSSAGGKAPDEFLQMRENMLEIQRQKMAERKSRKRKMEMK